MASERENLLKEGLDDGVDWNTILTCCTDPCHGLSHLQSEDVSKN